MTLSFYTIIWTLSKKDFDNTGRIFFTKKKGGLVVYTSTLRNTEQPASKELIENIKMLDLQ